MVIAVTQAALSGWGCPFITENELEHFSLTQGPDPRENTGPTRKTPLATNKSTGTRTHTRARAHTHTHTHLGTHTMSSQTCTHSTHYTSPLAMSCLLLRSPLSLSSWGKTLSHFECCSFGQIEGVPQGQKNFQTEFRISACKPVWFSSYSDFSLKSCCF